MFEVKVESGGVIAVLDAIVPRVREALLPLITADASAIEAQAKSLASGGALESRTGKYAASIKSRVTDSRARILGKVYSRDPRAPLFEFGGTQKPREILPDARKALKFMGSAGAVWANAVHRPAVEYKPRPTIHAAFDAMKDGIEQSIRDVGTQAASDIL